MLLPLMLPPSVVFGTQRHNLIGILVFSDNASFRQLPSPQILIFLIKPSLPKLVKLVLHLPVCSALQGAFRQEILNNFEALNCSLNVW